MKALDKLISITLMIMISDFLLISMKIVFSGDHQCLIKSDVGACSSCKGDKDATAICSPGDCECADQKCQEWINNDYCDWQRGVIICSTTCNDVNRMGFCSQVVPEAFSCGKGVTTTTTTSTTTTTTTVTTTTIEEQNNNPPQNPAETTTTVLNPTTTTLSTTNTAEPTTPEVTTTLFNENTSSAPQEKSKEIKTRYLIPIVIVFVGIVVAIWYLKFMKRPEEEAFKQLKKKWR